MSFDPRLTRRQFAALAAAGAAASLAHPAEAAPGRLRRADSFFGLHFDLHPNEKDTALGRDVSAEMVERLLAAAKPDFVQYDSKGHPGWLGWPSQVGPSAPGIVKDSLEIWRKVSAAHNVALYIHFSGVWDTQACARHPEWARIDKDGQRDKNETSTFGPYVDELMIRELREAASKYDLDGAWVDGECWATNPDYAPAVQEAFRKATGIEALPKGPKDRGWLEFLELNREQFRRYVRHYVEALHQSHPKFQIASNWLYSTFVPEEPTLPVDFLSGDYLGNASISTARLEARYLSQTGRPWDLMAWGFQQAESNKIGSVHKPAIQLQQEASVVLAQGGGFQVYYVPSRAGWFETSHIDVMRRVGEFCRARQKASHKSATVPQIGVVFSGQSLYATTNKLFGGWGSATDSARGWVDALAALQYSVDVVPDWKLDKVKSEYPLLVLPEWTALGGALKKSLLEYVSAGGVLLASGAANAELFGNETGIRLLGQEATVQEAYLGGSEVLANLHGLWRDVEPVEANVLASRFPIYDTRGGGKPAAVARRSGKGEIVLVPGPLGSVYAQTHTPAVRDFVKRLIAPRFRPLVQVAAPPTVEVVLRRKDGKLLIHLLNSAGMQVAGDYATTDFIPEVGPIALRLSWAPSKVQLAPDGQILMPVHNQLRGKNFWEIRVPKLHIHSVVMVEPGARRMV
ncbi:MAG: hypothetical protein P4K98_08355 [Bryobacteraceae bacterium]|nr:hypothetical protein [Bryobacteraceae bacterium]